METTKFELHLDLTHPSLALASAGGAGAHCQARAVARALKLAAEQVELTGICPGGVYGGTLPNGLGHWYVRTGGEE